jgi:hypothetical protein
MGCEAVARTEYDVLENAVRAMNASPDDAYWARRTVDLVRDPVTALRLGAHLVTAVVRWAVHDPTFFVHERHLSEQLAVWAWPARMLEDLEARLVLGDPSLEHLILGRLWLAARWFPEASPEASRPPEGALPEASPEASRPPEGAPPEASPELSARAALHLREVGEELRVGAWHEAMCEALGVADPDELARIGHDLLDRAPPLARERALVAILRGAARAARWDLYDARRHLYRIEVPDTWIDGEVARLDGERAASRFLTPSMLAPTARGSRAVPRPPASDYVTVVPAARSTPRPA